MDKPEKLTLRECLLGDRAFYRHVLLVVLPIIVQNTLTNVVSLLDNVMVGQVGTLPMSGVAVVGQLLFVYNLAIWGSTSGAGIFGAQFYGRGDMDGVRHTFRFKLLVSTAITAAAIMLFLAAGPALIGAYISADTSPADAAATLDYAWGYLRIMLVGLVPFGLTQCYAGTLRESGQTVLPMKASMLAMVVNFIFNALLIFGLGPFPRLGVAGAAIATVLSRFVELNICNTIAQIFNEVFLSLGNATAIVVGQELGADRLTGARRTAWRMITLSLASCVIMGAALAVCAPFIPRIYNTEEPIRLLATELIRMAALCMPLYGFANCEYFTLRSGGKTFITFLFDSCFTWAVSVPMAYCLSRFSGLNIVTIYLFVNGMDIIKCTIGFVLVKKGVWVKNIVKE